MTGIAGLEVTEPDKSVVADKAALRATKELRDKARAVLSQGKILAKDILYSQERLQALRMEYAALEEAAEALEKSRLGIEGLIHIETICELSCRAKNALLAEGICYLSEVEKLSDTELLRLPNIGRKVVRELREYITQQKGEENGETN